MREAAGIVLLLALFACSRTENVRGPAEDKPIDSWIYGASTDKMDDSVTQYAISLSIVPIAGETGSQLAHVKISIHHPETVILTLSGAQFHCHGGYTSDTGERDPDLDSCGIRVRFDDAEALNFAAHELGDVGQWLSIDDGKRFLAEMMKAIRVKVELPVFGKNLPVVSFDVVGFDPQKLATAKPSVAP
jgi:hypothetical protein